MNRRRIPVPMLVAMLVWGLSARWLPVAVADDESRPAVNSPLLYRKVFVPVDRAEEWPQVGVRYVPIKVDEVQRLLNGVAGEADGRVPSSSRVTHAEYDARLDDGEFLAGTLSLDIDHAGATESDVLLGECGLALEKPEWTGAAPRSAVLGIDQSGTLRLRVAKPGRLRCNWSLRGRPEPSGELGFPLVLPTALSSRFVVELPKDLVLRCEHGLLTVEDSPAADARRWRIELGGRSSTTLYVAPAAALAERGILRQHLTCSIATRGITVTGRMLIDVRDRPLQQLVVDVDRRLRVLDARLGDVDLACSTQPSPTEGMTRVVLDFPEPLAAGQRAIELRAIAPLVLDAPWRLPTLRPQDLFWQEETVSVLVPRPLVVVDLATRGCRQSKIEPLPGDTAGETLEFQYFSPGAEAELTIGRQEPRVRVSTATTFEIGPQQVAGRLVADCSTEDQECFELTADLGSRWQIDSIESEPPGRIEDWEIQQTGGKRRLSVHLSRALTPKQPLRLVVAGRLPDSALVEALSHQTLRMLDLADVLWEEQLVGLRARGTHSLKLSDDEDLIRLDPRRLGKGSRARFGETLPEVVYEDDVGAERVEVRLLPQASRHVADIEVALRAKSRAIDESFRVACRPDAGGVDRLRIVLSAPRPEPIGWTLVGAETDRLSARRLEDEAKQSADPAGFETWEIVLPRARTRPFVIEGRRSIAWDGPVTVPLIFASPFADQSGIVLIHAEGGASLRLDNRRLKSIPVAATQGERPSTLRASYRYDPGRDTTAPEPALIVEPAAKAVKEPRSDSVVWRASCESRLGSDGAAIHSAMFWMENNGRRALDVALPAGSTLLKAAIDGKPVRARSDDAAALTLELPPDKRFVTVRVVYASRESPWKWFTRFEPRFPAVDVPIHTWESGVWLPPGYRVVGGGGEARELSWRQRLLGPLAWSEGPGHLDWFSPADGRAVPGQAVAQEAAARRPDPPLPWAGEGFAGDWTLGTTGWSFVASETLSAETLPLIVVRANLWLSAGWGAFLLGAAGLWFFFPRRPAAWVVLLAISMAAAMLLPAALAPAATMLFLAAGCAALARWIATWNVFAAAPLERDGSRRIVRQKSDSVSSTVSQVTVGLILLALVLAGAPHRNVSQAAPPSVEVRTVHAILVPIDKKKRPVGDTWYVPVEMLRALRERVAARSDQPHSVLLTAAHFRGRLDWDADHARMQMTELEATYDVDVVGQSRQIRIPLGRGGVTLLPEGMTLDGRSVEPVWDNDGQAVLVDVPETGKYRLELALRPTAPAGEPAGSLKMTVPGLPTSELELSVPADASPVEIGSAVGRVHSARSAGTIKAQLGACRELNVSWSKGASATSQPSFDVDQLVWLKIRPGAVAVETRLKMAVGDGKVHRVELLADPRLRLLLAPRGASSSFDIRAVPGDPQRIVCESARGFEAGQEIALSFLWTDTSGVGRLRAPLLMPADARAYSGILAVSIDPTLEFTLGDSQSLSILGPAAVSRRWPDVDVAEGGPPALVCQLRREAVPWFFTLAPREPHNVVDQTLALSVSTRQGILRFDAELNNDDGYVFQYRLRVPPGFTPSRVRLRDKMGDRVARWSQSGTVLTMFLNGPVRGSQRLSVRGSWPLRSSDVAWPVVEIEDGAVANSELVVYRRPGCDVQVNDPEALRELTDGLPALVDEPPPRFGRLVGVYQMVDPRPSSLLRVRDDPARTEARQVTTLGRREGLWQATVDYQLRVHSGSVDVVRFQVPAAFRGPFRIEPDESVELVEIPGAAERQLVIRPREPIRREARFSITSPLSNAAGDRIGVPMIEPLCGTTVSRFVVLPKQVELEKVDWELKGLRPEPLPADDDSPPIFGDTVDTYRVVADRFQAVLRSVVKIEKSPSVWLADIRLAQDRNGDNSALAVYDLLPAGLTRCALKLPEHTSLLAATVSGVPVSLAKRDGGLWEFNLASDHLPQRIEILFRRAADQAAVGSSDFRAPVLMAADKAIDVRQTIWTVSVPRGLTLAESRTPAIDPLRGAQLRLDSATSLLADATSEESPDALEPWYRGWIRIIRRCRQRIDELAANKPDRLAIDQMLTENEEQQQQIAKRMRATKLLNATLRDSIAVADAWPEFWRNALQSEHAHFEVSFTGSQPSIVLVKSRGWRSAAFGLRLLLAALALGVAWLVVRGGWLPRWAAAAARWPLPLAVCGLLLGWWVLAPAYFVLLIFAVLLAVGLHRAVPRGTA